MREKTRSALWAFEMLGDPASILGFQLYNDIGEGGQARVRLGYNHNTQQTAAIKILCKKRKGDLINLTPLRKELKIHSALSHPNIIKLFGSSEDECNIYLVMEYAAAGELFDKIEPDVGIAEDLAHLYFHQLISSLEYLHQNGIAHRDLKPEVLALTQNMLLDEFGNLKLSDFGLATVFRHKGMTRILTTPCGTPPYVAPEIHSCQYDGGQVDIWSSGIILFVLLAGSTRS